MASPSDAHTPQSQKAAFSPCERRGAGLVLTLCPPWLLWKGLASMGHLSSLGSAVLSIASPFQLQASMGPPKPLQCLFNKDPHHLHNYHLYFPHHRPGSVGACRVGVHWNSQEERVCVLGGGVKTKHKHEDIWKRRKSGRNIYQFHEVWITQVQFFTCINY